MLSHNLNVQNRGQNRRNKHGGKVAEWPLRTRSKAAKDIETQNIAEERKQGGDHGDHQNLHHSKNNEVPAGDEVLVRRGNTQIRLHDLVNRAHIQGIAPDARDHHQKTDHDADPIAVRDRREDITRDSLYR